MRNAAIVLLMLSVTVPVFGEQSAPNPEQNARLGALRQRRPADPYRKLWTGPQALKVEVAKQAESPKPEVVCGMLIVPADPTIDPKMRITPPQDPTVEYKIRTIDPPTCNVSR